MAYDEVSKRATNKYRKKRDTIQIYTELGQRDLIAQHAKNQGESLSKFINRAIKETMERDINNSKKEA